MGAAASLAERAVACKHWRWMPGMLARHVDDDGTWRLADSGDAPLAEWSWWLPDLDDPATLGCIAFALLPEAWGVCTVELEVDYMVSTDGWWAEIEISPADTSKGFVLEVRAETRLRALAEVLIAALEAAPDMRNRCAGMLVREVR